MPIYDGGYLERPEEEREGEGEWEDSDDLHDEGAPWRGDVHLDDWPESLAGPEYEAWKKKRDEDRT